jgi:hypothetical protein
VSERRSGKGALPVLRGFSRNVKQDSENEYYRLVVMENLNIFDYLG